MSKESSKFAHIIRDLTLLTINQKQIASDDYLSYMCHSAYQSLMQDATLIFYNYSNPLIDQILINLCHDKLIERKPCSLDSTSYFDQHFYKLTLAGAWEVFTKIRHDNVIVDLLLSCSHGFSDYEDPATFAFLQKAYGPFISVGMPK